MAPPPDVASEAPRQRRIGLDLRPFRGSRDYRALFIAGLVGTIGEQGTYVVVPYQMKLLTGSVLDVGLLGAVEIVPLVLFGILGGALADAVDKRRMIIRTEALMLLGTAGLLANATIGRPRVWVLFVAVIVFASADALQRPSLDSIVPRLVPHDQLAAASSLSTFRWTFGSIIGPIAGGTVAVAIGPSSWFAFDAATFAVTLLCFVALASSPPTVKQRPDLRHVFAGVGYAIRRRDLLGTYLIDFSAMLFAFPVALFPFLAARYHDRFALGLLYAGLPIGALLASITSRWTARVRHHGRAIVAAAVIWGLSVAAFGLANGLLVAVLALVVAGGADAISGMFRQTMWNASIPDEMRGRMAGIELLSYSTGPELGQLRSALVASATSLRTSVVSGGLICAASCGALVALLPTMWRFDATKDTNVAEVRAQRAAALDHPEP
ncbi:MAG TPA: MFS transporter [Acidimicrobiales bacterium]|nr:MFS transporter [Acidimicrobiales bacterium]